jgi:RHS repeat-associated protein
MSDVDGFLAPPTGGGAVRGIGETFSADPQMGTGNFSIPIPLPRGRNGFQPSLALAYSTGFGRGHFGLGWTLGVPTVARQTLHGLPRYAAGDVFVLSGAEDLVPLDDESVALTAYRPRTEGLFAEIEHDRRAAGDVWRIRTRDGAVNVYGTPGRAGSDPATIARPGPAAGSRDVFSWSLTSTTDPFGNTIVYEYDDLGDQAQCYLRFLRYVDYVDAAGAARFLVSLELEYEDRPDGFSERRAGFEVATTKRCRRLVLRTHADMTRQTSSYTLEYANAEDGPPDLSPTNDTSLLVRVTASGHDGPSVEQLPPLDLGYTMFEADRRNLREIRGRDIPAPSLADPVLALLDAYGGGSPDLVEVDEAPRVWRNRGDGTFDWPRRAADPPVGVTLADPRVRLLDCDGNGRPDLLVTSDAFSGYFPLRTGGWDRRSFRRFRGPSTIDGAGVSVVDLTGDGVPDAIRAGPRLEVDFGRVDGREDERRLERRNLVGLPRGISFDDPRVRWADMSGDGLVDLVLFHSGSLRYWPSLGFGAWDAPVFMRGSPTFPDGYDPARVLVGDIDGDGTNDVVFVGETSVSVWLNRGGRGFAPKVTIQGTPSPSEFGDVRLVDLLGTGIAGLLWSSTRDQVGRPRMFFLDFTGGHKPYLLNRIDNHLGAITEVEYASSTQFFQEAERRPETRWHTALPTPVHVVSRLVSSDRISGGTLTTRYVYGHGHRDGIEGDYRGFARVDRYESEVAGTPALRSPSTLRRTWYHLGPVDVDGQSWQELDLSHEYWRGDPPLLTRSPEQATLLSQLGPRARRDAVRALRGRVLREEVYGLDDSDRADRPYAVREQLHELSQPGRGVLQPWSDRVFFPYLAAERTTQWERGDDPQTVLSFTGGHDALGRATRETQVALPRRAARRRTVVSPDAGTVDPDESRVLAMHSCVAFAQPDAGLYLHDRVAQLWRVELTNPPTVAETDPDDLSALAAAQLAAAIAVRDQFEHWQPETPVPASLALTGHRVNHFDGHPGEQFLGRDSGVGPYGALTRREELVFTDELLDEAYAERRPGYLGGVATLPAGAPAGFGDDLSYRYEDGTVAPYRRGWYAELERHSFDFHQPGAGTRGMLLASRNAYGGETILAPDPYGLLNVSVTDALDLVTELEQDYRVLKLASTTDPNGAVARYWYSPLGLLEKVAVEGPNGEGGSESEPDVEYAYDLEAYRQSEGAADPVPVFVHTRRRVQHASVEPVSDVVEAREYSDGFGRVIQRRVSAQEWAVDGTAGLSAEPGSTPADARADRVATRVAASTWLVFDNAGRVRESFEPFLAEGWAFQPEAEAAQGQRRRFDYDALGRLVRTIEPDGAEQRTLMGVPADLRVPTSFEPTPWERTHYDANDLATTAPMSHRFTPRSELIDALGRMICTIRRNGSGPGDTVVARARVDVRGNLVETVDPLGRSSVVRRYDLLDRPMSSESIDAGWTTIVRDPDGVAVEERGAAGTVRLSRFDVAGRLVRRWARDAAGGALTLREVLTYGDELDPMVAGAQFQLGRLVEHYDEAGRLTIRRYDFEGNPVETARRVVSDSELRQGFVADWDVPVAARAAILAGEEYRVTTMFDALGRAYAVQTPSDVDGVAHTLRTALTPSGQIARLELDGATQFEVQYDAHGRRTLASYGDGTALRVMTRYAYDPETFRLARLRTEPFTRTVTTNRITWSGAGPAIQDLTYGYDPVGNVTSVEDRTPGGGIPTGPSPDRLRRSFTYDPLYRLTTGDGREEAAAGAVEPYSESFRYDAADNLLEIRHAIGAGGWTRTFGFDGLPPADPQVPGSNRLTSSRQGVTTRYEFDDAGNVIRQNTERTYVWDHAGRLIGCTIQPPGAALASVEERYLYDARGSRIKVWSRTGGSGLGESTVFIDAVFESFSENDGATPVSNSVVHVVAGDDRRIALHRFGPPHPRDPAGLDVQYHLADHLGSSVAVLDASGTVVNREDYAAFGGTTLGSFARKRFRFLGRERDERSGLSRLGARSYAPWLGRFVSCDAQPPADEPNPYVYARDSPVTRLDPSGRASDPAPTLQPGDPDQEWEPWPGAPNSGRAPPDAGSELEPGRSDRATADTIGRTGRISVSLDLSGSDIPWRVRTSRPSSDDDIWPADPSHPSPPPLLRAPRDDRFTISDPEPDEDPLLDLSELGGPPAERSWRRLDPTFERIGGGVLIAAVTVGLVVLTGKLINEGLSGLFSFARMSVSALARGVLAAALTTMLIGLGVGLFWATGNGEDEQRAYRRDRWRWRAQQARARAELGDPDLNVLSAEPRSLAHDL